MNIVSFTALVTALGSIALGALAYVSGRRRDKDQAVQTQVTNDTTKTDVVLGGFHTLVEDLQKERDYFRSENGDLRQENDELKRRLGKYEGVGD